MSRALFTIALALVAAGCTGAQSSSPAPTLSAPPTTASVSPTPTRSATAAPTPPEVSDQPIVGGDGGAWIVYQLYDGSFNLRLVRPNGSGDHAVFAERPHGDQQHPDWSPNGSQIAYVIDNDIWIADVDGANDRRLFECTGACVFADSPAWSPDGLEIAFTTADGVAGEAPSNAIMAVSVGTATVRTVVTSRGPDYVFYPRWSPDGKSIVVSIERFATKNVDDSCPIGSSIAIAENLGDAASLRRITDLAMFADYPDWSPDGSKVVFSTFDLGARDNGCTDGVTHPSDLYTIRPDGTNLTQLTHNPSGTALVRNGTATGPLSTQPSWTSDGASIMFVEVDGTDWPGWTMATIGGDGSGLAPATASGLRIGTHPRLRPLP